MAKYGNAFSGLIPSPICLGEEEVRVEELRGCAKSVYLRELVC